MAFLGPLLAAAVPAVVSAIPSIISGAKTAYDLGQKYKPVSNARKILNAVAPGLEDRMGKNKFGQVVKVAADLAQSAGFGGSVSRSVVEQALRAKLGSGTRKRRGGAVKPRPIPLGSPQIMIARSTRRRGGAKKKKGTRKVINA